MPAPWSALVLRWLGLSVVPAFVSYALTHYLIARRQQRLIGFFTAVMLGLHATLLLLWIPRWGPLAPALSIVIAESVLFTLCLLVLALSRPAGGLERIPNDNSPEPATTPL